MDSEKLTNAPNFEHYNSGAVQSQEDFSQEQMEKLKQLTELANGRAPEDCERSILNRDSYLRYLKANNWNLENSLASLLATIEWRKEFGVDLLKSKDFTKEGETGKIFCSGFDTNNRPLLYMRPSQQNTSDSLEHIRFTVYSVELAIKMLPPGVDKLTIIIDLRGYALKHAVPLSESRQVLHILSNYYPERLGKAIILDAPWVFSSFFRLISPFIDPITRDKVLFSSTSKNETNHLCNFVPKESLSKDLGGTSEFEYDSHVYFNYAEEFYG